MASEMECVDPESINATMVAPRIAARSCRVELVQMPVTACTEMVTSSSAASPS